MVLTDPDEARRQRILLKRQQAKQQFSESQNKIENEQSHDTTKEKIKELILPVGVDTNDETDSVKIKKPRLDIPDPKSIISNVYRYLDQEYKFMKIRNADDCSLHLLSAIRQRTAAATGVSVTEIRKIVKEDRTRMAENKHRAAQEQRNNEECGKIVTETSSSIEN